MRFDYKIGKIKGALHFWTVVKSERSLRGEQKIATSALNAR